MNRPPTPSPRLSPQSREAGFSLIELMIALLVMTEALIAILMLFTSLSDVARVQTSVAEMQQTQRIAQREMFELVRNAGYGGLPITARDIPRPLGPSVPAPGEFPDGLAIEVINNVPLGTRIAGPGSDEVVPGSDILIVRGVFTTPIYYISPQLETRDDVGGDSDSLLDLISPGLFDLSSSGPQVETIKIEDSFNRSPFNPAGIKQDLQPLIDALEDEPDRLLIARDLMNPGAYGVMQSTEIRRDLAACGGDCIEVRVELTGQADALAYADLMNGSTLQPGVPGGHQVDIDGTRRVAFPRHIGAIGILDEFRFYLRADPTRMLPQAGNLAEVPTFVLSRLSVRPGTDVQIGPRIDIADNLLDLQIAAGIDRSPLNQLPARGQVLEDGTENDEVLFNHPMDTLPAFTAANNSPQIQFIRITTLVHAGRPERGHQARSLLFVEDSDRSGTFSVAGVSFNYNTGMAPYRRRLMSTVVDLRNVQ